LAGCAGPAVQVRNSPVDQGFVWPLEGELSGLFGSKRGGITLKGIYIKPGLGSEVKAVQSGKVLLVSPAFRGYGKTVILGHENDLTSVYAGLSKIEVKAGQTVKGGIPIGKKSLIAGGALPEIYFEIRKSQRAEDPLKYLPKRD